MATLLSAPDLPPEFSYPPEFIRAVESGLTQLEPWEVLQDERLFRRHQGLQQRFPERRLVPFAARGDNDDVACWDLDTGRVAVIHDYASPGWEPRYELDDFNAWLRRAVDDFIEFE
jgi:hypothetical protein